MKTADVSNLALLKTCEMFKRMQYLKDVTAFFYGKHFLWQTLENSYNMNEILIMEYTNLTVKICNYNGSHIDNYKSKRAHKA